MTDKISFSDFTMLPDQSQFTLVFTEDQFINFREVGNSKFVLYKLYNFFVELQYDILQNNSINTFALIKFIASKTEDQKHHLINFFIFIVPRLTRYEIISKNLYLKSSLFS